MKLNFKVESKNFNIDMESVAGIITIPKIGVLPVKKNSYVGFINYKEYIFPLMSFHKNLSPINLEGHHGIVVSNKDDFYVLAIDSILSVDNDAIGKEYN